MKRFHLMNQSLTMVTSMNLKWRFDVGATSHETTGKASEDSEAMAAYIFPYKGEPIADSEWVEKYEKEKEKEKLHVEALQQQLDGTVATSEW